MPSLNPGTPDDWNGGTGNWSNGGNWSAGAPGGASDVTINTGSDNVTLDVSPTINSLTLAAPAASLSSPMPGFADPHHRQRANGGRERLPVSLRRNTTITAGADSSNAGQIYLYDGASLSVTGNFDNKYYVDAARGGSVLNVTGKLTNEAGAYLYEQGGAASIGSLVNNGIFVVGSGASVNLTNQPGGITSTTAGSRFDLLGSFNDVLGGANGFANLTNNGGAVIIANGLATGITPNGGTFSNPGYPVHRR